jgi:hypothetical protein
LLSCSMTAVRREHVPHTATYCIRRITVFSRLARF